LFAVKVFLSYALEDQELARDLATRLSEQGYEVWFDEWQILPGDNFAKRIGQALEEAEAMIVLVSPAAMKSKWVREEINFALGSQRYAGKLVPVIVEPTDDVPWILERLNSIRSVKNRAQLSRRVVQALEHASR
jgi:hypothetical protein